MKVSTRNVVALLLSLIVAASLVALTGCGGGTPAASSATDSSAAASGSASTGTAATGTSSTGTASSAATSGTGKVEETWVGNWYSKSEIVPPEQETDQYELKVAEDGSFTVTDNGAALYSGTINVTNQPETGWGVATIKAATVKVQMVNAQGVYKLILNAGDDWDKSLKKIVFMR